MRIIACFKLGVLLLGWQLGGQSEPPRDSLVQITASTVGGVMIDRLSVVVTPFDGGKEVKASGRLVELSLPAGVYLLRAQAPGFESTRELLTVYAPKVLRTVSLARARLHGEEYPVLTGTVENYGGDVRDLRVRTMALNGNEVRESAIDERGTFAIPMREGDYLLVTLRDGPKGPIVLNSQSVRVMSRQSVIVNLLGN